MPKASPKKPDQADDKGGAPRHPREVANELAELHRGASLAFVPLDVQKALALVVEFASSVAATYEA